MISTLDILFDRLTVVAQTSKLSEGKSLMFTYDGDDWKRYVCDDPVHYHKELVCRNCDIDMYVISWKPRASSCIHDHPTNGCIVKILKGELQEDLYKKIDESDDVYFVSSKRMHENDIGYMESNKTLHKIKNPCDNVCVSLHIYSKSSYIHKIYSDPT
jgi:cysteine dioxygenase